MVSIYKTYTNIVLLLCLTLLLVQTASAQFTGRTWAEFTGGAKAVCADDDIDNDNDGLIELCYLEDVDAMRNNLRGTSLIRDSITYSDGCGGGEDGDECFGYELVRDLDFKYADSYSSPTNIIKWTTNEGWQPIGEIRNFQDRSFTGTFEGNGHTIFNLTINRPNTNSVGLFGRAGSGSKISNISLLNVSIGAGDDAGGLVGWNNGSIANSYVTGSIAGEEYVGGLTGYGDGDSRITNSYATSSVAGEEYVGGLIGENDNSIANSYATGSVDGETYVGGFTGWNETLIKNSYATGFVDGDSWVGGFTGFNVGNIEDSFWDTVRSERTASRGGIGKTTGQLRSPMSNNGIYANWDTDNWDFGTDKQYPAVKYARVSEEDRACYKLGDEKHSQKPACDTLLRGQRNNQPVIISPTTKTKIVIRQGEENTTKTISVKVSDDDINDKLTLLLSAEDVDQTLVILETAKAVVLPNDNANRAINEDLIIKVPQILISGTTTLTLVARDNSGFDNAMSEPVSFKARVVVNTPPAITPISSPIILPLGTSTALNVVIQDAESDPLNVQLDSSNLTVATATIVAIPGTKNYRLTITGSSPGEAIITVTASDGEESSEPVTITILVDAEPTGTVSIGFNAIDANTWRLTATSNVTDANGIAATNYQWFRKGNTEVDYTEVGTDSDTYPMENDNTDRAGGTEYKVEVTFEDNIGQSVTTSSNVHTVENEAPMIKTISQRLVNEDGTVNGDGTVNEGGTVSITANTSDANHDRLHHTWRVTSKGKNSRTLTSATSNNGQFSFDVPANWIKDTSVDNTTRTLSLKIVVSDGSLSATQTAEVVVTKVNNGPSETSPRIERNESNEQQLALKTESDNQAIAADPDGDNSSPNKSYQWQRCQSPCSSSWTDIDGQTGSTYTILNNEPEGNRFRIKLSYTDGQGYTDNTIFTNNLPKDPSANISIRAKVFLEGPLQ